MLMGVSRGHFCSLVMNSRAKRLPCPYHCPPLCVHDGFKVMVTTGPADTSNISPYLLSPLSCLVPPPPPARAPPVCRAATSSKQQACVTSMHRMLLHDGFKVMETTGPADTVDLLASITKLLAELYAPRTSSSSNGGGGVAQPLEGWKAGITTARRTKTVGQKWQELLMSVQGGWGCKGGCG